MKKRGGNELPAVRVAHAPFAHGKIVAHETGLVSVEENLRDENGHVQADQGQENNARLLRPALWER
jgi:hypothetical protein